MFRRTMSDTASTDIQDVLQLIVLGLNRRKKRLSLNSSRDFGALLKNPAPCSSENEKSKGKFSVKDLPSASNKACMSTPERRKRKTENIQ